MLTRDIDIIMDFSRILVYPQKNYPAGHHLGRSPKAIIASSDT